MYKNLTFYKFLTPKKFVNFQFKQHSNYKNIIKKKIVTECIFKLLVWQCVIIRSLVFYFKLFDWIKFFLSKLIKKLILSWVILNYIRKSDWICNALSRKVVVPFFVRNSCEAGYIYLAIPIY